MKRQFFKKKASEKKGEARKKEFPNIHRPFTVSFLRPKISAKTFSIVVLGLLSTALLVLVAKEGSNLFLLYHQKQEAQARYSAKLDELSYWMQVVKNHPGYRDAYFKLAVLEHELGNTQKAKQYLEKTLYLDPNFEPARKLETTLNN